MEKQNVIEAGRTPATEIKQADAEQDPVEAAAAAFRPKPEPVKE